MGNSDSLKGDTGFTFIGVLIFVAILAAISTTALTLGSTLQRRDAEATLLFVGKEFRSAFKGYYEATPSGQRRYPATLNDLLKDPRYPSLKRYLRKLYLDPLTGKNDWVAVASPEGGIMGVHSPSTATPIKTAGFPDELQSLENQKSYSDWVFFYK